MNKTRRVLFLTVGTRGTVSTRLRVYNFLPTLHQRGFRSNTLVAPRRFGVGAPSMLWSLLRADVIVIQKALICGWLRRLIGISGKPRVYDLDDALFALPPYLEKVGVSSERMREDLIRIIKWADIVTVANTYLSSYVQPINANTVVIPTVIDTERFQPTPKIKNGLEKVIGWVGAADARHFENVRLLVEPLKRIAREKPFVLRVIGIRQDERYSSLFRNIRGIEFQPIPWMNPDDVPKSIRSFDIGLSPLIEDSWTLGKCPTKVLEYMASGVITVASAVGTQMEYIQHGSNGFLVAGIEDWIRVLRRCLQNDESLQVIRDNAIETVQNNYSVRVWGDRYSDFIETTLQLSQGDLRTSRRERSLKPIRPVRERV